VKSSDFPKKNTLLFIHNVPSKNRYGFKILNIKYEGVSKINELKKSFPYLVLRVCFAMPLV
jgi:hypothetical protein